jgi:hypothetical protein
LVFLLRQSSYCHPRSAQHNMLAVSAFAVLSAPVADELRADVLSLEPLRVSDESGVSAQSVLGPGDRLRKGPSIPLACLPADFMLNNKTLSLDHIAKTLGTSSCAAAGAEGERQQKHLAKRLVELQEEPDCVSKEGANLIRVKPYTSGWGATSELAPTSTCIFPRVRMRRVPHFSTHARPFASFFHTFDFS